MVGFKINNSALKLIKGTVTDSNGSPLEFASVYENGTSNGAKTNGIGFYQMPYTGGTVKVSYVGLPSKSFRPVMTENNITLGPPSNELKNVTIKAKKLKPAESNNNKIFIFLAIGIVLYFLLKK